MDINFETLSFLHVTLSAKFFDALAALPPSEASQIAEVVPSTSERNKYPFLGELGGMREWLGGRIVDELKSYDYAIVNRHFEKTMAVLRTELADDQGGLLPLMGKRAEIMARAVGVHPDELIMQDTLEQGDSLLCYDGLPFFDASHPMGKADTATSNDMGGSGPAWYILDTSKPIKPLIHQLRQPAQFQAMLDVVNPHVFFHKEFVWGADTRDAGGFGLWQSAVRSQQTLTAANFLAARQAMHQYTNDKGRNMGMRPTEIWVPRGALEDTARKLFGSDFLSVNAGAGATASTENNYLKNAVTVKVSNYLSIT